MHMRARQIVLAARPKGRPQLANFRLEETAIPTPAAGQLLLETQYLSLDPYMRGRMDDRKSYATPVRRGDVIGGEAVARALAANHSDYAEGEIVLAPTGWRTHALSNGTGSYGRSLRKLDPAVAPVTTGLGVSACRGSLPMAACERSAPRSPVKPWWSRRRAGRSDRWSGNWPSAPAPRLTGLTGVRRNASCYKNKLPLTR